MRLALLTAGLLACLSAPVLAQTVTCQDGTQLRSGQSWACARHGGVQAAATPAAAAPAGMPPDSGRTPNPMQGSTTTPAASQAQTRSARGQQSEQAPGGGPGMVWVNASSKAYHCPSDRYYGRTKRGSYMTEAAAKGAGAHPSGGKACS